MMRDAPRRIVTRVQTGVRIERRILLVLKGLAGTLDLSLGDLLEGIVLHAFVGKAPFGPEALAKKKENEANALALDPEVKCYMPGVPRANYQPYPFQIVQTPTHVLMAYEFASASRIIYVNGKEEAPVDSWMGHSNARWDGDTFVIDTVGLKEWMFDASLDLSGGARWHSDALHFTERLRFNDPTTVSYTVTIDDPKIFTAPWSQEFGMKLHPTWKIFEFVCEENNRCQGGQCAESEGQKK